MLPGRGKDADQLCRSAALFDRQQPRPTLHHLEAGLPDPVQRLFNKELRSFHAGMAIQSADLADEIIGTGGIEGIRFSGGEPFCQAGALAECAGILKEHGPRKDGC